MKIETKKGRFYVNLPVRLYQKIKEISKNLDDIDLAMCGLLLHFILSNKYKDKNLEKGSEWTTLNATILRNYNFGHYKTKRHLDTLIEHEVLEKKLHYVNKRKKTSQSRRYKVNPIYYEKEFLMNNDSSLYMICRFSNFEIVKKIEKHNAQRRAVADYKCEHLTKWLKHEGFEMEVDKVLDYVNNNKYLKENEREKRIQVINSFSSHQVKYSREGKDDRLHSYFTSMPSDLKQFVKFEGQSLMEADIKNSQPFIFCYILNIIKELYIKEIDIHSSISLKRFSNKLHKVFKGLINEYNYEEYKLDIRHICNSITIMLQKTPKPIDFTEIDTFNSLVRSGKIYEYVGEKLLEKNSIKYRDGKFWVYLFDKEKEVMKYYDFDSLRKSAKKVTINALYGSPYNNMVLAIEHFKELFPEVAKYLKAMKSNEKADLPILMQRIESKSVLDHCSKRIAKKHPKMPLICRHDSLSTTTDNFEMLHFEFQKLLTDYFEVEVNVGDEPW